MEAPISVGVVCDNTMGIPGLEIDDGLALLYLLGCPDRVRIEAVCATHGNAPTEQTFAATTALCAELGVDAPVLRGADAGSGEREGAGETIVPSPAARAICELAQRGHASLLSLGATTDLAAAERLAPGTLAAFDQVSLMGGVRRTLILGGRIMDELNFSVDAPATLATLATARAGLPTTPSSRLLIADAHHCLPLTFGTDEFVSRLISPASPGAAFLERTCLPWMQRAARDWGVRGFVGWDVLAAVALAEPEMVRLEPCDVTLDLRMLAAGHLEPAADDVPPALAAHVWLVAIPDPDELREHVYTAWARALDEAFARRFA